MNQISKIRLLCNRSSIGDVDIQSNQLVVGLFGDEAAVDLVTLQLSLQAAGVTAETVQSSSLSLMPSTAASTTR